MRIIYIETCCRYIRWAQQVYTDTRELIPLIERCADKFMQIEEYKNDTRYVKVWMHYVSFPCAIYIPHIHITHITTHITTHHHTPPRTSPHTSPRTSPHTTHTSPPHTHHHHTDITTTHTSPPHTHHHHTHIHTHITTTHITTTHITTTRTSPHTPHTSPHINTHNYIPHTSPHTSPHTLHPTVTKLIKHARHICARIHWKYPILFSLQH
jgi:Mad3/BUB1 homology region 1